MKKRRMGLMRWGLLAVLVCTFLYLGMGATNNPGRDMMPVPARPGTPGFEAYLRDQLATVGSGNNMSDLSLAKRENVDFVLTSALLVQEAVSDGVVLTYPEE